MLAEMYEKRDRPIKELCELIGISKKTLYQYLEQIHDRRGGAPIELVASKAIASAVYCSPDYQSPSPGDQDDF